MTKKIAVLGAGWAGVITSLRLAEKGYDVKLIEKLEMIVNKTSGNFGARVHHGYHYLRSIETQKNCANDRLLFSEEFDEAIVNTAETIYVLATTDSDGNPSKVDVKTFEKVCMSLNEAKELNRQDFPYKNILSVISVKEQSLAMGEPLRKILNDRLNKSTIKITYNCEVKALKQVNSKVILTTTLDEKEEFDFVVNATGYQALLPEGPSPFDLQIVHQPTVGLLYIDSKPQEKRELFTVVDGLYPSFVPYEDGSKNKIILTHAKYGILSSYEKTPQEAYNFLSKVDDKYVEEQLRANFENDIERFWPGFSKRYIPAGWKATVLAKVYSESAFRSPFTFKVKEENIAYIFPGKIVNTIAAADEIISYINGAKTQEEGRFEYLYDGILARALPEIKVAI